MKAGKIALLISLVFFQTLVSADDITHQPPIGKDGAGFGLGAIIGGLVAGPPGAVIGAFSGGWLGVRESEKDRQLAALEQELNAKSIELAYQQNELASTRAQFEQEFQKVMLNREVRELEKLSQGISYVIYYKTDRADLRKEVLPRIRQLAELIKPYARIKIRIEGHADRRGSKKYNLKLSQRRIETVRKQFLDAGIPAKRLQTYARGENEAKANEQEEFIFDRRVTISLTLDQEV